MNGYRELDVRRLAHCVMLEESLALADDAHGIATLLERELKEVVPGARRVTCQLVAGGDAVPDLLHEPSPLHWRHIPPEERHLLLDVRTNSCAFGYLDVEVAESLTVLPYEPFLCHVAGVAARQLEGMLVRELFEQSLSRLQGELASHAASLSALEQARHRLDQVQTLAHIGVWELALATDQVTASQGFLKIAGWEMTPQDISRARLIQCVHPRDRERFRALLEGMSQGAVHPLPLEFQLARPDGAVRDVVGQGYLERTPQGAPSRLVFLVRDVTHECETRAILSQTEEEWRTLGRVMREGFIRIDPSGHILEANPAFFHLLGYRPEDLPHLTLARITPERWHALDDFLTLNQVERHGASDTYRKELIRQSGEALAVGVRMWGSRNPRDGMPTVMILFWELAGEPRPAERTLEAASDAPAEERLVSAMSHDLRAPVSTILGAAELLQETGQSPRQRLFVDLIHSAGELLLDEIDDLLDYHALEDAVPAAPFELDGLIREVFAFLHARNEGSRLVLGFHGHAPLPRHLLGDRARLRRLLIRVAGIAIHLASTGEVVVSVEPAPGGASGENLLFTVRVPGQGVDARILDGLFLPPGRGGRAGRGLGLFVTRKLVERMGGRLWADLLPGHGAAFHLVLPLPGTLRQPVAFSGEAAALVEGVRVLLVGGDVVARFLLQESLTSAGLVVTCMERCDRPLLSSLLSRRERCDLLLILDHPHREEEGIALAEALRARPEGRDLHLVLAGIDPSPALRARASRLGVPLLRLPVKRQELLLTLAQMLQGVHPQEPVLPPQPSSEPVDPVPWRHRRILLAEDSPDIAFLVKAFFKGTGAVVEVTAHGAAALEVFKASSFDLVLMDMQMPIMDGYEASRAIRDWELAQGLPRTPMIALTAHAMVGDADRCLAAGCDQHLAKPVRKKLLLEVVGEVFRRRGQEGGTDALAE